MNEYFINIGQTVNQIELLTRFFTLNPNGLVLQIWPKENVVFIPWVLFLQFGSLYLSFIKNILPTIFPVNTKDTATPLDCVTRW